MKNVLGLDLGTNSIGWSLVNSDFDKKEGSIKGLGGRIIPLSQGILDKFGQGQSHSQTAERTNYRGTRRLYQRNSLRRERLHRVLNILDFLPAHYADAIDLDKHFGQFKEDREVKLNYRKNNDEKYEFIFKDSFLEMVKEFKQTQPELFYKNKKDKETKIPYDWTIYYLRKKALTKKISKEELAWIILNFNRKRGYYQLRGEDKIKDDSKLEEYYLLKVIEVQETKDKNSKGTWYNVILENGWIYRRQSKVPLDDWLGKDKEFIVTTILNKDGDKKLDKDGNIKRSFRAVDSEKDWPAIKAKTEQDIKSSGKKVGAYIYETLLNNPKQKIRGKLIQTIEREVYREELGAILTEQIKYHDELKDKNIYAKCVDELYPRNEIHNSMLKQRGFKELIIDDIIFYQRPLKSKKSTIANCQYETRFSLLDKNNFAKRYNELKLDSREIINEFIKDINFVKDLKAKNKKGREITKRIDESDKYLYYKKSTEFINALENSKGNYEKLLEHINIKDIYVTKYVETNLKGIPKSHPLFQEFRLWQFLSNLRIYNEYENDVTSEILKSTDDWVKLFDFLSTKKEIEQKNIIDYLIKNSLIDKNTKANYHWNYIEDKKFPMCPTRASFISRLKKVKNIDDLIKFLQAKSKTNNKNQSMTIETNLWHIIYSVKDKKQFDQALKTFARKNNIDVDSFFEAFQKYPPFKNEYGAYSEKALKKILPLMRMGKYWNENIIPKDVKDRITRVQERLKSIDYDEKVFKNDRGQKLETIVDDAVPKQLLKSFVAFKNKNHLEGLNTYQACYVVYERHSEVSEIKKWKSPKDIDSYLENFKQHSLRNPIVEQVITETLRTVRNIWQYYGNGEKDFFDEIHIELGRDMKNPADKRKRISERISENENTNQRIKALLQELMTDGAKPFSPSHQEILKIYEEGVLQPEYKFNKKTNKLEIKYGPNVPNDIKSIIKNSIPTNADIQKYKLWLEQKYMSPYTGKIIPLGKLFSTEYQIEHIIPQARYFDNSLSNKVICESEVNKLKGDKTAYEFINDSDVRIVDLGQKQNVKLFSVEQYEAHCQRYFSRNRIKLKKLLSKEIPEGFIERQLNDTRYISKFIKGLLSNIVREENEREITSKNLIPVTGAITSELKNDWGLNEVWNEIIQPRFERLNKLTNSKDFGDWDYQRNEDGKNLGKKFFRLKVPDEISKGFSKKRIDHRHHSLDALVIACTTRNHIQYLNSLNNQNIKYALQPGLLIKNDKGNYTKQFKKPWNTFTTNVKNELQKIVITFKQNTRIINKTNNKTWQWVEKGTLKKEKVKQTKGINWAIRKPLHKEMVYGKLSRKASKDKIITAIRTHLTDIKTVKHLEQITDSGIKKILINHLKRYTDEKGKENYELAFCAEGIDELNKSIVELNNGKFHQPIYKVRLFEEGKKFSVSEEDIKSKKYVEAAKGTNLFFAIYWNEDKQKRKYETIPLNNVIGHQIWRASLPKAKMKQEPIIPIDNSKGRFLFSLSPNDLVYVPTDEEIEYPHNVDFNNLTKEQFDRIYIVNDFSNITIYFTPNRLAKAIASKEVDLLWNIKNKKLKGSYDTKTASFGGKLIKEICWKLKVDRLGNILSILR